MLVLAFFFLLNQSIDAFSFHALSKIHTSSKQTTTMQQSYNNNEHKNQQNRHDFFQSIITATLTTSTITLTPSIVNAAGVSKTQPTVGLQAPDFNLPNSEGKGITTLSDLTKTKKWTVLYFYPGAFTKGCTLEARGFQKDISQYQSLSTQIVGVSVDSVEKNAQFCQQEALDFYMLSDAKGVVSSLYGSALSVPGFGTFSNRQTYIIDPDGNLRWVFTDVESHVARHSEEVLSKLKELQNV